MSSSPITIFQAKKIITMNPSNPEGTHVAVREGRILGVGSLADLSGWGDYELDETFKDKVLIPGLIEAHAHFLEGAMTLFPYIGYFERPSAKGGISPGVKSYDELIRILKAEEAKLSDPNTPLIAQGFDPIYFDERLTCKHLDEVSTTRPIFIFHASAHLATVNTAMLQKHNITRDTVNPDGVSKFENGEPNGELQEIPAMFLAESAMTIILQSAENVQGIWNLGYLARNVGVTTVTDLGGQFLGQPKLVDIWKSIVNDPAFPARVHVYNVPAAPGSSTDWDAAALKLKELQENVSSEKFHFPGVKFVLDGSIQGFTAVLNWPSYYKGKDQGLLLTVPEQLKDWMRPFHKAGINIHAHCNGDKTIDIFLDAVEELLKECAWLNHRHTVQHSQLTTSAQFRRMKNLGICANIFSNHIWYWGDQHYEITVGPERANRMEACATAKREGVHFSIHSDANVTPLGQLHTMWCAVNRLTPKGRVLGEYEKISPYDALYAVTVDAAYQQHLDHEMGSIECGKLADFTVLDESPLDVDPLKIRDIPVWGTVVSGVKYEAAKE